MHTQGNIQSTYMKLISGSSFFFFLESDVFIFKAFRIINTALIFWLLQWKMFLPDVFVDIVCPFFVFALYLFSGHTFLPLSTAR